MPDMRGLSSSRWAPRSGSVPSSSSRVSSNMHPHPGPGGLTTVPVVPTGKDIPDRNASPSSVSSAPASTKHVSFSSPSTATVQGLSAPKATSLGTPRRPDAPSRLAAAELSRYTRIVRRMKWKLPFLAEAYRQATARPPSATEGAPRQPAEKRTEEEEEAAAAAAAEAAAREAQLMFKLDFFDYYMLLERALVHLQLVFGVVISRDFNRNGDGPGPGHGSKGKGSSANGLAQSKHNRWEHSYHANVLSSLDRPGNPLHGTLGTTEVRRQLSRAKDLRNRWKNADDPADDPGGSGVAATGEAGNGRPVGVHLPLPLESYDLENILAVIFDALDRAFGVAEAHVRELAFFEAAAAAAAALAERDCGGSGGIAGDGGRAQASRPQWADEVEEEEEEARQRLRSGSRSRSRSPSDEEQWGFMLDAMDWEAI